MNDELKATLESLLQGSTDSCHALETAANNVTDTDCLMLLRRLLEERSLQSYQLQEILAMEQEFPRAKGTLPGDARQAWIAICGTISSQNELTILPEVAKLEDQLRRAYEAALPLSTDSAVGELVAAHYENISAGCEAIASLHESIERTTTNQE